MTLLMITRPSIRTPTRRDCELCGREEKWDKQVETWVIVRNEGQQAVGDPHCIHEWDINGAFSP